MGRAQQYRQAITIRFNEDDEELVEWLGQFAQASNMTKVVKLACYLLSGIQPQEGLLALMPEERFAHSTPVQQHKMASTTRDIHATLAAVTQEMVALRQEISDQRLHHAPEPYQEWTQPSDEYSDYNTEQHSGGWFRPTEVSAPIPGEALVASSGIDLSSRRRRPGNMRAASSHPTSPKHHYDPDESSRLLVKTIREFSSNLQRGQR